MFGLDKTNKERVYPTLIIVLAGTAIILGYSIYGELFKQKVAVQKSEKQSIVISEEREVLKFPSQDAPAEEKQRHYELVVKLAKEADFLDISKCIASPLVFKTKNGKNFLVKNNDFSDHEIQINEEHRYTISANSSRTILADFGYGQGLYGYGCDNSGAPVGLFLVEP